MKLTASMILTLDGMDQGPGPDEDRRGGFERGVSTAAFADEDVNGRATFGTAGE
jgi:hypothetical protein